MFRVGLISDTHGLLRREAKAFLRGSDHIVHGGDICDPGILEELASLAPLTAVRGNNDRGPWAERLRETEVLQVGEVFIYVIHDLAQLDIEPNAAGVHVVVSGHSHKPLIKERNGVLYVNPGSSGPRRFKLPIAVGELLVEGGSVSARIVDLGGENGALGADPCGGHHHGDGKAHGGGPADCRLCHRRSGADPGISDQEPAGPDRGSVLCARRYPATLRGQRGEVWSGDLPRGLALSRDGAMGGGARRQDRLSSPPHRE